MFVLCFAGYSCRIKKSTVLQISGLNKKTGSKSGIKWKMQRWQWNCLLYKLIVAIIICDMVPSQIFPVKPGFGVITTKMATDCGHHFGRKYKYHLMDGTQSLAC